MGGAAARWVTRDRFVGLFCRFEGALAEAGMRVYAIDLLGYGYSDKPFPTSPAAKAISGENGRQLGAPEAELGTAWGGRRTTDVVEPHPLGSVYNFYTWSEQLLDFVDEVVGAERVCLVANSIGSISALQAAIDAPGRVSGVAIVNPNFRELHVSEQPALLRPLVVPLVSAVQRTRSVLGWSKQSYDTVRPNGVRLPRLKN